MDSRLLETLIKGDAHAFCRLLDQDSLLLDWLIIPTAEDTPLHVASLLGHEELVGEILRRRPGLANYRDVRGLFPLHIAAAKGHLGIAKKILETDPSLSRCRDKDGQTPLHLAAANGHAGLLVELLPINESFSKMMTETGKTVLHLSVKFNQVEVVKFLVEGHKELINLKDESGITALHLASAKRNVQIIHSTSSRCTSKHPKEYKFIFLTGAMGLIEGRKCEDSAGFDVKQKTGERARKKERKRRITSSHLFHLCTFSSLRSSFHAHLCF